MNRREFTKLLGAAAAAAALPMRDRAAADMPAQAMDLDPRSAAGFDAPLLVPGHRGSLLRILEYPRTLDLVAGPLSASVAGTEQDLLAYRAHQDGQTSFDPVLKVRHGQRLRVDLRNALAEDTIVHWHGLTVSSRNDGLPTQAIPPGGRYLYDFEVRNRGGTYWYHPHPYPLTAEQAYRGLASFFIVEDEDERRLADALDVELGHGDIPVVIQDKRFDSGGRITYAPNEEEKFMGFLGNVILVNLTAKPRLEVVTRRYRLRLLNGSNARIYRLAFSGAGGRIPMQLMGTDGGLLDAPVDIAELFLAPGERADVVLDLRGARVGEELFLKSLAFDPMDNEDMGAASMQESDPGMALANGEEFYVMKLAVTRRAWHGDGHSPRRLSTVVPIDTTGAYVRPVTLTTSDMKWFINGTSYAPGQFPITVRRGAVEVWEIANDMMSMPHPMHIHGFQFQVLERMMSPPQVAGLASPADGRLPGDRGYKDTVLVWPGETVRVAIDFSHPFAGEQDYVFHCHNLEHEDNGMMIDYRVI